MPELRKIPNLEIDAALSKTLATIPVRPVGVDSFKSALTKLAGDSKYRDAATQDPTMILKDFKLSLKELSALRSVAAMSGADVHAVDGLAAKAIASRLNQASTDVDVSCCSCCCCCCGETAAAPSGW
ncbi:MAG: hypothetical protein R3B09_13935 [Nannocystaceae bacterium]